MQFVEHSRWLSFGDFRIDYHLGVDGISILLVMLTTFLTPIVLLSGWTTIKERLKEYLVFMLALETGMLGVFLSLDLVLFYVFWELVLIPMYFIIGIWGGARRIYAAVKFFIYTMVGSVLMLLAIIFLYIQYKTLDITQLGGLINLPLDTEKWLFAAFFLAFAIKVPLFPLHTWLPDAHVEAPTPGSVILAGVHRILSQIGILFQDPNRNHCGNRHNIWCPRVSRPAGYEKTCSVLVGQPPWFRGSRAVRRQYDRHPGWDYPDGKSRAFDRRALPDCRYALRVAAYEDDKRIRRVVEKNAGIRRRVYDHRAFFARPAGTERFCGRVQHTAGQFHFHFL
jgi:hypothetical protein